VHVLAWIADEMSEKLIREAPAGTRFIFCRNGIDAAAALPWLERMRRLSPRTA